MNGKNIRVVTFDVGGTLLYPYPSVGAIYSEVMKKHDVILDSETLEKSFRRTWKEVQQIPRAGLNEESEKNWWRTVVSQTLKGLATPTHFEALFEDLWFAFAEPSRWKLHLGTREILSCLKQRGYQLVILSNWDKRLHRLLDCLEMKTFFEDLIISSEVGCEKPDPSIFRIVEKRLGISANEILHVGDSSYHDHEGAQKVGWTSILIKHQSKTPCSKFEISQLSELLNHLPSK